MQWIQINMEDETFFSFIEGSLVKMKMQTTNAHAIIVGAVESVSCPGHLGALYDPRPVPSKRSYCHPI